MCGYALRKRKYNWGGGYENFEAEGKGGTLTVSARVSNGASRYAMPTIHEIVYAALLYPDNERPENPPSDKFVEGKKADDSDNLIFSFQRPDDTSGTFTLEIFAFVKADDATTNFSRNSAPFSKAKAGLTITGDTIIVNETIALEVNDSPGLTGTVGLKITVPDGCTIEINDTTHFTVTGTAPNLTLTHSGTGIPVGAYQVTFTVKKEVNESVVTVHVFSEYINVLPGICTDTWWNGNVSSEIKDVTQSMSTTLYVRGVGGWYDSTLPYNDGETATASDNNSGSFLSPLASIQKAVDTIIARNDGMSACTIYVDGTVTQSTAASANGMADFSALGKNLTLTIQSLSGTATLDANALSRVIYAMPASGALNLTLEKLVITGGNITGNGGGIYYQSTGGTLEMTGCEVIGCEANYGGGVYVYGGTFTMSGGEISNCTATNGGGVYVSGGTFTMESGTISECTASSYGGGVSITSTGTFNMSGTAKIAGCKTTSTSSSGGGGIYNAGTLAITGGTISGCTSAARGGGVYVNSGTFMMSGGEISNCIASFYGGGVFITSSGTFNMSGTAKITGCKMTSTSGLGGGVYVSSGTFTMGGSASIPAGDDGKNDVNLASGKTITVADALTAASPVATITLSDPAYVAGTQVLSLAQGSTTTLAANCEKFEVSQTGWKIDEEGKLAVSLEFYVSETGADTNSGSRTKPFATIQKALDTVIEMNDASRAYTIYIDGTLKYATGTYTGTNGMADFSALDKNLTLTIKALSGTATLDANKKSHVIYAEPTSGSLNLTLENLVITNGYHSTGQGGGIYFDSPGGTLTMNGGAISNNRVSSPNNGCGGGCSFISVSTVTMNGVTITGNTAGHLGGGVYFAASGTFIMEGGTISGNIATSNGGGVYVYSGTFTMSGGEISDCTATNGGGVYVYGGTFTMGGSASIPAGDDGKNDVRLASGKTITVAGALNAASPVATITPSAYTAGTKVLSADGTDVTSLTQTICDKFTMTSDPDGVEWKILPSTDKTAGVLATMTFYVRGTGAGWYTENPSFSAAAGSDTTGNGTKAKPFATIQKALDTVIAQNDGSSTYRTIYFDGTLTQSATADGMADFSALDKSLYLNIHALSTTTKATLDANKKSRVIYAKKASGGYLTLTMKNLNVMNGYASTGIGGGIYYDMSRDLYVTNCTISGCEAGNEGGGVYKSSGNIYITDCTISGNKADYGGGMYIADGLINSCSGTTTISGNSAKEGGGLYLNGSGAFGFTMNAGTITANTATEHGGGVYKNSVVGDRFIQNGGTISGNTPDDVYTAP